LYSRNVENFEQSLLIVLRAPRVNSMIRYWNASLLYTISGKVGSVVKVDKGYDHLHCLVS